MKQNNPFFICCIFLFLTNNSLLAQSNFLNGEIVTNTGAVVSGQIDYKKWIKSPISVTFQAPDKAIQVLTPQDLRAFTVILEDGSKQIYSSFTVDIDFASLDLKKLDSKAEPDLVNKAVFLRNLVNGEINLYSLVDESDKRHYFISKGETLPKELTYRKYYYVKDRPDLPITDLRTSTGVNQVKINAAYKNELYNLMADNQQIKKEVFEKLPYKEKELVELVDTYNGESSYVRPFEKMIFRAEIKAGIAVVNFTPKNIFSGYDFPPHTGPSFGIGLNASIPRTQWSIQNDLRYAKYQTERRLEFSGDDYYEVVSLNFAYLKLQTTARYQIDLNNKVKPYLQGGILNGYLIKDEISTKRYFYGEESNLETAGDPDKLEQGLIFGGGIILNKITAGIDYEISNGFAHGSNAKTIFKNLYLSVGYRF